MNAPIIAAINITPNRTPRPIPTLLARNKLSLVLEVVSVGKDDIVSVLIGGGRDVIAA
jgi:hypothetical protein